MSSVLESCTFNQPQQLSNQRIWKLTKTWIRRHCRCRHRFHDSLLIEIEPCPIKTFDGQDKPWTWSSPWNWTCSFRWTPGREDPHTSGPRLPSGVGSALSHWFSRPGKVSNEIQTKIGSTVLNRTGNGSHPSLPSPQKYIITTFKEKYTREAGRIGSIIIFHLSKLWKAKFFILYDVIFLVRLPGKFEIDHSWEWKADTQGKWIKTRVSMQWRWYMPPWRVWVCGCSPPWRRYIRDCSTRRHARPASQTR